MAQTTVLRHPFISRIGGGRHRWFRILLHIAVVVAVALRPQCRKTTLVGRIVRSPRTGKALVGSRGGAAEQEAMLEDECGKNQTTMLTNTTLLFDGNKTEPVIQRRSRKRWFRPQVSDANEPQRIQRRRWFSKFNVPIEEKKGTEGALQHNGTVGFLKAVNTTTIIANSSSPVAISAVSAVPTTNRGGALVKERPAQRQNWLLPPATKLVERVKHVQNVWWVNTWSDQLPTRRDEEEMARVTEARRAEEQRKQMEMETNVSETLIITSESPDLNQSVTLNSTSTIETPGNSNHTSVAMKDDYAPKRPYFNKAKRKRHQEVVPDRASTSNDTHRVTKKHKRKQHVAIRLPSNIDAIAPKGAYISSGYWRTIDQVITFGFARAHPRWRLSSKIRPVRKLAARLTGLHGALSGKPEQTSHDHEQLVRAELRMAAIVRAKQNLDKLSNSKAKEKGSFSFPVFQVRQKRKRLDYKFVLRDSIEQKLRNEWRDKRMKEIGKEMHEAQQLLARLACEKDVLQERHNPMWKYSVPDESTWVRSTMLLPEREFVFPSEELVDEYLDMLFATGRLVKLNHTDLWRNGNRESNDDDDELSGPSPNVNNFNSSNKRNSDAEAPAAGNWFLRNGLGELIGEKAELAAYKAVCKAIMEILAKGLSNLHGLTVMDHSDIRISTEETPQLPPIAAHIPGSKNYRDYAENAINNAIRNRSRRQARKNNDFIQKAAIVETLTSQCQLAAPIMNLFPLNWQRAIISNVISLVTAVIADFCEGIEFQILGHKLSISFTPITQEEMLQRLHTHGSRPRRKDTEGFEEAVRATAETLSENLKLLDRWHERALGSGALVFQISTLIARLVLFLVDDILSASRIDLWSAHTGGPRLLVGFEYRASAPLERTADGPSR